MTSVDPQIVASLMLATAIGFASNELPYSRPVAAALELTTLDRACALVGRGFSVIPLDHPDQTTQADPARIGKTPVIAWKEFQSRRPTRAELNQWFGNGHTRNIGIPTGAVSGVIVVDADNALGRDWMNTNLPATPMRTRTAKGEHWFYRHPGPPVRNKARIRTGNPDEKLDVRGDGGFVVGPGSKHVSGSYYEPLGTWPPINDLPVFDPAWLESETPKQESRQARRARERADQKTALRRARAYVDRAAPAIEGQGGDTHTFSICCAVTRGFDLEEDDAFELLQEWNERCEPPWPDADLREKLKNAREYGTEPVGARLTSFPLTEVGDAEYFADLNAARIRFDHAQGRWLVLNDVGIWCPDPVEQLRVLTVEMMRERQRDGAELADADARKRAFNWAVGGESRRRISNTLREARALPSIADDGSTWDKRPWLLGTPAGVVDLQTGVLRTGLPDERITMRSRVTFDPDANCPLWEQTLEEVFNGSQELIEFVWRALGYSLTGDCSEECFFVTWGHGGNGKGTVMNTIAWVMGEYADDLPFSTLERTDRSSIPADLAKLVGKRFVTASESGETTHLNEARIKALTGRDPITARFLHRNFFTFQPDAKFWLATNKKPIIRDDSDGFWRRVHLIPFTQSFVGRADARLKDRLREEAPGILAWLVRGAQAWQRDGLRPPQAVRDATVEYRRESEPLAPFIEQCCVVQPNARVQASVLYEAYLRWCDSFRIRDERLTLTAFGLEMAKRFKTEQKRHKFYIGIGLPAPPDPGM